MSKNVKIIIIIAVAALVIGMVIFFYNKKKKADALAAEAAKKAIVPPTPLESKVKRMQEMKAAGLVNVAGPKPNIGVAMATD